MGAHRKFEPGEEPIVPEKIMPDQIPPAPPPSPSPTPTPTPPSPPGVETGKRP